MSVRDLQDYDIGVRGWTDIRWNFLVDVYGRVYEGRGWGGVGASVPGRDASHLGVGLIGRGELTAESAASVVWLAGQASRRAGRILPVVGHSRVSSGAGSCPGLGVLAWLDAGLPAEFEGFDVF